MYNFGWWTTGRDEAALELLLTVLKAIEKGEIRGRISYVFVSRAPGESYFSDKIMEISREKGIPVVTLSAMGFRPELRKSDRDRWRDEYHKEVLGIVRKFQADCTVLAGYMWVVSEEACKRLKLLNLHPALPGGPQGTWQEVIWKLIEKRSERTGAMMHLVTPELDKGPPVTYFSFPIKGPGWDELWDDLDQRLKALGSLEKLKKEVGEALPLFKRIREEGVKRELPLIVATMQAISQGDIDLEDIGEPLELNV